MRLKQQLIVQGSLVDSKIFLPFLDVYSWLVALSPFICVLIGLLLILRALIKSRHGMKLQRLGVYYSIGVLILLVGLYFIVNPFVIVHPRR